MKYRLRAFIFIDFECALRKHFDFPCAFCILLVSFDFIEGKILSMHNMHSSEDNRFWSCK